ncbi:DUF805 domain-containing protein [Acetivibrio cellulolyticus]|uniref:DUF805 domain-containing protein n=1 Tax=Acetivibrio cellulolyticus TaxID=35830 RepID=UPI0001E2F0D4|nr:DUF805 domain-containing protein [Acetivibrio cellulolyticus]
MEWYLKVLKQYADFSGRARRKEYWMFYLFNCIIAFVLLIPFAFINDTKVILFIGLYFIYALGVMIPSIAVLVRRLHDIDKSGWWYFISFVPFIGSIWLLVLLCTEGTRGRNSYGPDPKETEIVDISF